MEKFYFSDEDSTTCYPLSYHLESADKHEKEITLVEAIPDNNTTDFVWCHMFEAVEKCDCSKKFCNEYKSKSGRGRCENKGKLFMHGDRITFKVDTGEILKWVDYPSENCPVCGSTEARVLTKSTEEGMVYDGEKAICKKCDHPGTVSVEDSECADIIWMHEDDDQPNTDF
jgi:hypothetical protein